MPIATLLIAVEGGADIKRALGQVQGEFRRVNQAVNAEARRAAQERRQAERAAAAARRRAEREEIAATRAALRSAAADRKRTEREVTAARLAEIARQKKAEQDRAKADAKAAADALRVAKAAARERRLAEQEEIRHAERIFVASLRNRARAERAAARSEVRTARTQERGIRARTRQEQRDEARQGRAARETAGDAAGAARDALEWIEDYGNDLRQRRQAREALDRQAMAIASGDIGDRTAAPAVSTAIRSTVLATGLDPGDVAEAIGQAQSEFSALADAASRGTYLGQVLPMLAQAAVGTGASLESLVTAAGEFQRQFEIPNAQLPQALAAAIAQGRLGSISFRDQARHMGVIGGLGARFLSTAPEARMQSLAATNALFQFAGRAGGGGDLSATRVRALLENFTNPRGQRALRGLLGRDVLDAQGQILTRRGESQTDAFARTMEEAYARAGGNPARFLAGVAGANVRGRALGDQLFRDMRQHGGRLTDFRALIAGGLVARPETAISGPAADVLGTAGGQRALASARDFYAQSGTTTDWAGETELQLRGLRGTSPLLARAIETTPGAQGAMDLTNRLLRPDEREATGQIRTRMDQLRAMAYEQARARFRDAIPFGLGFLSNDARMERRPEFQRMMEEDLARLVGLDRARGRDPEQLPAAGLRGLEAGTRTTKAGEAIPVTLTASGGPLVVTTAGGAPLPVILSPEDRALLQSRDPHTQAHGESQRRSGGGGAPREARQ